MGLLEQRGVLWVSRDSRGPGSPITLHRRNDKKRILDHPACPPLARRDRAVPSGDAPCGRIADDRKGGRAGVIDGNL